MEKQIVYLFNDMELAKNVLGSVNGNLMVIEEELDVELIACSEDVKIKTNDSFKADFVANVFNVIETLAKTKVTVRERDVLGIIKMLKKYELEEVRDFYAKRKVVATTFDGRIVLVKSISQKRYYDALEKSAITFAYGAAGTGKTYLAVAYAAMLLKKNKIKKLIITRPVVEAGEKLGFLPGDLKEKVDPYLIPIYDALYDILGHDMVDKLILKGNIEIAPLAYMRGRTLDNAFIILDEAQNTTSSQMKMFLTRLGFNSQMVITGDLTQIDLAKASDSGLAEAVKLFGDIKGISLISFDKNDVMRHPLVSKIINQYEKNKRE